MPDRQLWDHKESSRPWHC